MVKQFEFEFRSGSEVIGSFRDHHEGGCNGLRGHGGLQRTSEVTSDLKIQLSDLNNLCYHASLASKCLQ